MKKIGFELKRNMLLTTMIAIMLVSYGCSKKSVDLNQKELTEYIKQIRSDNWKDDRLKLKELQKLYGVLLYNQLPIEKDSITYKFHRVEGAIQNVGYFKNNEYVELNECYGISRWIKLNYLNSNAPDNLLLQCTEYSRTQGGVNKESEILVDGNTISITSYQNNDIAFRSYNSAGTLLEEGNYKIVLTNTRDTIIEYNPFNYEEKVKLVEGATIKSGTWRYFDKNGKLLKEEKHETEATQTDTLGYNKYKNGKKDGLWKEFDKNGQLASEGYYVNGKANGLMKWYYNGDLAASGNMKDDKRDGLWKICDVHNLSNCTEASFKADKKTGIWKLYHDNGELWKEQNWDVGKMLAEKCWDEKGDEIACK